LAMVAGGGIVAPSPAFWVPFDRAVLGHSVDKNERPAIG
jgi:hypothetical protein